MKRLYITIMSVLFSIAIAIVVSYAWFFHDASVNPIAEGSSGAAYFAYGNGTSSKPYGINNKRHLYNFAWLTYLYPNDYNNLYYEIDPNLSSSLDMGNMVLPPIGKDNHPFTGYFNGNGKTITNLITSNSLSDMSVKPNNVASILNTDQSNLEVQNNLLTKATNIGFFGSISSGKIYDFYLNNTKVQTKTSTTCIGTVAGYVNGTIEDVGVIAPHLNIQTGSAAANATKTTNLSDYAVVGYAEEAYTTQKTKTSTIIYNPTYNYSHFNFKGMGNQSDWGGSMNMTDLYNRLVSINDVTQNRTSLSNGTAYIGNELRYQNIQKNSITSNTTYTRQSAEDSNTVVPIYYLDAGGSNGTYLKTQTSNSWGVAYQGLTALYKDIIVVTKAETIENGYSIANNSNGRFLNIESEVVSNTVDFSVTIDNYSSVARTWVLDSSKLYTYNEDDGYAYYLVANSDLSLSVTNDRTLASSWIWDNTTYKTIIGSTDYFLKYFNDEWTLKNTYVISDGANHYIKYDTSETNNIGVATSIDDATPFMFTYDGATPYGKIYTTEGAYIRNNNGTLRIDTTDSNNSWSNSGEQLYIQYNNNPNYIQYDNGWTLKTPTTYYIEYNGNYLYLNSSGQIQTSGTTNINNATEFTISNALINGTGSGTISTTINNQTYYLRYNNYNTFDTSTSTGTYTTWSNDGYGFYQTNTNNNTDYYIQYNNGWKMSVTNKITETETGYYISYSGSNYLTVDLSNAHGIKNVTNTNDATLWHFSNAGTYPSGTISTIISGITYYVTASTNGYVELTTVEHTFTNSSNKLSDSSTGYGIDGYYSNYWHSYRSNNLYTMSVNSASRTTYVDDYDNTPFGNMIAKGVNSLDLSVVTDGIDRVANTINEYTRTTGIEEPSLFNYIPLNASASYPYTVENSNTGYIMSGGYHTDSHFDIRVSRYAISSISSSYANSNWKNNSILTVGANGYGTTKYIGSGTYPESLFSKYTASKAQLLQTLKQNSSYVFGLHFMDASININNLVIAPEVKINGNTYYNYEMPENSIDFQLASKGYINFFAGTYFTNNDSFFSLHQIIRDSNNKITSIKHISQIYKANETYGDGYKSVDFIYKYDNNTWSGTNVSSDSRYSLAFDKAWIENPESLSGGDISNSFKNYLWYFEIPVNKGEYALGSVSGGTGAYLIYLDIGANAAPVDRTIITQRTDTTKDVLKYVNGIQILATGASFTSDSNTAVAYITTSNANAANNNDISITRSGNTITITNATLKSWYYDEGITLSDGTIDPVSSQSSTSNVLKYLDYNRAEDKLYQTTIYNNGTTNTGYDCYRLNKSTMEKINLEEDEWGLLKIVDGSGTPSDSVTDSAFSFSTSTTTKILDYYSYILTSNASQLTDTNDMVIADNSSNYLPPADGEYTYEHSYKMTGNAITMTPDDLLVYFGPTLKNSVTVSGPTSNVATVTITVSGTLYTFTFNADAIDNTNKTVTIYVSA